MQLKRIFKEGTIYHIFNKSISNYNIFKSVDDIKRFLIALDYYNNVLVTRSLSDLLKKEKGYHSVLLLPKQNSIVKFISYCIMPDHYHILVKTQMDNLLSKYMNDLENSFTRYFNIKHNRKGPLWQSAFKFVRIRSGEQLLHVSRYIHLNPTTNNLVEKPEEWEFSSYGKFTNNEDLLQKITEIPISNPSKYKKFVEDQIDYQRKLKRIKKFLLE